MRIVEYKKNGILFRFHSNYLSAACEALIKKALESGSEDKVTVVLVKSEIHD